MKQFRQIKGHAQNCSAMASVFEGYWDNPWWMPGRVVYADALGRVGRGSRRWHVVECNSRDCDANGIIRENSILAEFTP